MKKSDLLSFEQQLMVDLMVWPKEIGSCSLILRPDDFHYEPHQKIYTAMVEMFTDGTPIDLQTVYNRVAGHGVSENYLMEISKAASYTGANIELHAKLIHAYGRRRRLHQKLSVAVTWAIDSEKKIEDVIGMAEAALHESVDTSGKTLAPASEFIVHSLHAMQKRQEGMITESKPESPRSMFT